MRFKALDLNLLVALDVLLEEKNVTRAAERLNVSQPAMSAALSRLRDHFKEPLLVLHGKRMVPTPAALMMREPLKALLQDVEILVTKTTHFDPQDSDRRFRIITSDYLLAVIFTSLTQKLEQIAPGVTMECFQPSERTLSLLDQGDIDLVITPEEHVSPNHPSELLFEEKYVVAGWAKNPALKRRKIKEKDFFNARHVVVEIGQLARSSFAETHLRNFNERRRIDMKVPSFLIAPEMVVNTMKLTVMHERLARLFAQRLDIAIAEMPFDFPVMREMIQFHESRRHDAGLRWLVDQIKQLI
ncbi:LysR family transcriptional regulator [Pseudomaricurvus alcaniphilus]|uniref:LysR family transcriptional regulator n=1 Tax=Pseudomaricurvus alcaniphilus TaxID=1166482 RepID=UPI00140BD571|nr:LysR family transcriptional regulator [Pseudomaricurvus alcaniphilus]NHN39136.1 LysR family transcriptional regulator [Pseudomaricurvus alcaniphilus]